MAAISVNEFQDVYNYKDHFCSETREVSYYYENQILLAYATEM